MECHKIGTLTLLEDKRPVSSQIHFSDPALQVQHRLDCNTILDRYVVGPLQQMTTQVLPSAYEFEIQRLSDQASMYMQRIFMSF